MNSNPHETSLADRILPRLFPLGLVYAGILIIHMFCFSGSVLAGGLTILTHGYQPGDQPESIVWLDSMVNAINAKTGDTAAIYEIKIQKPEGKFEVDTRHISGPLLGDPANKWGHVIIKLNWKAAAGLLSPSGDEATTGQIAQLTFRELMNWSGYPDPKANPIHLIGHSRGGSVVCEVARLLGEQGIWVDHQTTLDPQPVTSLGDVEIAVYETVNFADNYFQRIASIIGQQLSNSYSLNLTNSLSLIRNSPSPPYYTGPFGNHSNIHYWYFGTIDTTDSREYEDGLMMDEDLRNHWYAPNEHGGTQTGYYLSRLSAPDVNMGVKNRANSTFGSGLINDWCSNRVKLNRPFSTTRTWPNIIDSETTTLDASGLKFRTEVELQDTDSFADVRVYVDKDRNKDAGFDGFYQVGNKAAPSMPYPERKSYLTIDWSAHRVPSGSYWVHTEIEDVNHRRQMCSLGRIQITNNGTPPPATVTPTAPSNLTASAISPTSIKLAWQNTTPTARVRLQQSATGNDPWTNFGADRAAGVTEHTVTGLRANTTYYFRAIAVNGSNLSPPGEVASAKTQAVAAPSGFALSVNAGVLGSNESLTVNAASWTGFTGYQTHTTPFTRTVTKDIEVGLSFPATLTDGRRYQYAMRDDGVRFNDTTVTVPMNASRAVLAIYGLSAPAARTVSSLAIEGQTSVNERQSITLRAKATYNDSSTAYVRATWSDNSSDADISSAGVLDADDVSSDRTVTVTASHTSGGVTRSDTHAVTIRNTTTATTYTLNLSATNGHITPNPKLSSYAAGTQVTLTAYPDDDYKLGSWSGDASGTGRTITVRMDRNRNVSHAFILDTSTADVVVTCLPSSAAAGGAAFKLRNSRTALSNWQPSGDRVGSWRTGECTITFKDVPGWITPEPMRVSIQGGGQLDFTATYREVLGAAQVAIQPQEALTAGGRWRINAGAWQESGTTLNDVAPGNYTLEFKSVPGWQAPSTRTITVIRGGAAVVTENYAPAAGQPVIANISPAFGTPDGGTIITLDGANFLASAVVNFGGARAVTTFVNNTRITAVLPASSSYGSVAVSVTSGGQTVTRANGFTYNIPLGMNMTQLGQIGGSVQAVAAAGSMVYYGEGNSIVAADYTNASTPIIRGRLPLPGMVSDIEISGSLALVANINFGLQIVDITNPAAMKLMGLYDTAGTARRLAVRGKLAYIADSLTLDIIDFTNVAAPIRKASIVTPDNAYDVTTTVVGTRTIACVAADQKGVLIYDVTNPQSVSLQSIIEEGVYHSDTAAEGTQVLARGQDGGVKVYDISNPASPTVHVNYLTTTSSDPGIVRGSIAYLYSTNFEIWNFNNTTSPTHVSSLYIDGYPRGLALSGTMAYLAADTAGLMAVNLANPANPMIQSKSNSGFSAVDVTLTANHLHVSLGGGYATTSFPALTVLDISNPRNPQRRGTALSQYGIDQLITTSTSTLAAAADRATTTFNVGNVNAPVQSSATITDRYSQGIAMLGGDILIAGQARSSRGERPLLTLLNGSNPNAAPISTLELQSTQGVAYAPCAHGTTGFVFQYNAGLRVINYNSKSNPSIIGNYNFNSSVLKAVTSTDGRYVYAADQGLGLLIFDCQNRTAPQLINSYNRNSGRARAVAIQGNLVFHLDSRGLNILDVTAPSSPVLVASYDTPGIPTGISVNGTTVYVADGAGGVQILELGDVSKPLVQITAPTSNSFIESTATTLDLAGTASDAQGITKVSWSNQRGGGGVASGTASWTVNGIKLQPGVNIITVYAEDTSGNVAEDTLTIHKAVPDTLSPQINITGPTAESSWITTADAADVRGTAADNVGVTSVSWISGAGASGAATINANAWVISSISLVDGPNAITVTARDLAGNTKTDSITLFKLPPDDELPAVLIRFPTASQDFATKGTSLHLAGEAADNRGIRQVRWSNDRGGSGLASGKTAWQVSALSLAAGINVITVTVEDDAGNTSEDRLTVTSTPPISAADKPPVVTITAPTASARLESAMVIATGRSSGKRAVQEVLYQLNDGYWTQAEGVANWSISLTPPGGLNVLRVKCVDAGGYESPVISRSFTRVVRSNLTLAINGQGTVRNGGFTSPVGLEIGRSYTLTATPKTGWIFAGWSGGLVSASPTITFTMQDSLAVTATFVANPFVAVAGAYLGLARAETTTHATSGLLRSTVTTAGAFSGALLLGGKSYSLSGKFDSNGQWVGQIARSKQLPLSVLLMLDVAGGSDTLTGLVSDGSFTAAINTDRATFNAKTNAAPSTGRYTFVIESEESDINLGYGAGTLVVDAAGKATLTGRLADTTAVTFTSQVSKNGRWPLHALLYSSGGSITGEMLFADLPDSDNAGGLHWYKPGRPKDAYFKDGFDTLQRLRAQRFTQPGKNIRLLTDWDTSNGAGIIMVSSLDLPSALIQPVIWTNANIIQSHRSILPRLTMTPVVSTGLFSGSFLHPATRRLMPLRGALLQKTQECLGWLQGATSTGSVRLEKAPSPD